MCTYCGTNNYRKIYKNHTGTIPKDYLGRRYEIHHIDGNHNNNNPDNLIAVTIQEHYNIHYNQEDWPACLIMAKRMKISPEETSRLASLATQKRIKNGTHHFLGDKNPMKIASKNGTHHFLGGEIQRDFNLKRVADGTHPFLGGEVQRKSNQERLANGTHHLLGPTHNQNKVKNGTHNWLTRADGSSVSADRVKAGTHNWGGPEFNLNRVANGTHPFMKRPDGSSYQSDKVKAGTHHLLGGAVTRKQLEDGTHPSCNKISCIFCKKTVSAGMFKRWHGDNCRTI